MSASSALGSVARRTLDWSVSLAQYAAAMTATAGLLLYAGQGYLLYQPSMPPGSREQVPTPGDYGMADWEEVDLTASDSTLLKAFVIYAPPDPDATSDGKRGHCSTRPTVLMLHANAGNVGHRMPLARVFVHRMRCNVVALSYRGYGKSQGKPSEKGILDDAQTTLDWTCSHDILGPTKKLLYGQSLGGAVSIGLAAGKGNAERLSGVILENTFLNIRHLIPSAMPVLGPFRYLCHQTWYSDRRIATLPSSLPFLFLSGARDELIPPAHFRGLWELSPATDKQWKVFPFGTHNDTCVSPGYFEAISVWIRDVVLRRPPMDEKVPPKREDTFSPARTKTADEELRKEGAETLSRL